MFQPPSFSCCSFELLRENWKGLACFGKGELKLVELKENRASFLHPEEEKIFSEMRYERRQFSFLLGRYLAKRTLWEWKKAQDETELALDEIWIQSGVFQFPVVSCSQLSNVQVSLTHASSWGMAIAFPEVHPMAIDLEPFSLEKQQAILSQTTDSEHLLVSQYPGPFEKGLVYLWTVKEGLSKVLRTGLMTPFSLLELQSVEVHATFIVTTFKNFSQYKAISGTFENQVFSIVLPRKTEINPLGLLEIFSQNLSG